MITEVRRFRAEQGIKPRRRLAAVLQFDDPAAAAAVPGYLPQLQSLAGLDPIRVSPGSRRQGSSPWWCPGFE